MAMALPSFYIRDLSLHLSIVHLCNTLIIVFETYLQHWITVLISVVLTTSLCQITFLYLKLGKLFDSSYWRVSMLMSAYLTTSDDSTNWNFWSGLVLLNTGFSFLIVHCIVMAVCSCIYARKQPEQQPEKAVVPLMVEIAFAFIGNGMAIMVRWVIPGGSIPLMMARAACMFVVSSAFSVCFVIYAKKIENDSHLQDE